MADVPRLASKPWHLLSAAASTLWRLVRTVASIQWRLVRTAASVGRGGVSNLAALWTRPALRFVLTLLLLLGLVYLAITPGPKAIVDRNADVSVASGAARLKAESDVRGNLLSALVPLAILAGSAVAYLTLRETRRQNQRSYELARRDQVTERFSKAVDQLGQEKLDVRIGAVYALEHIARDSPELHPPVIELLTAFLREHASDAGDDTQVRPDTGVFRLRADFQAIATVLGRRDPSQDVPGTRLDLRSVDLRGARLARAQLDRADLDGAQLQDANLEDVNLEEASLTDANVEGARLFRAHLARATLVRARFGKEADLRFANLEAANLSRVDLEGARLFNASLVGAQIVKANLQRANLRTARLNGAVISDTNLERADLLQADLTRAQFDEGVILKDAMLYQANLAGVRGLTQQQLESARTDEGTMRTWRGP